MSLTFPSHIHLIQKGKIITDGLVCALPMTGVGRTVLDDVSGHQRSATWAGGTSADSARVGTEFGAGYQFVRSASDYFDFGAQNFGNTSVGTICVFVSQGVIANTEFHNVWSYGGGNVVNPGLIVCHIVKETGNTTIQLLQRGEDAGGTERTYSTNVTLEGAGFKHIAVSCNGTARNVFMDGAQLTMTMYPAWDADSGDWFAETVLTAPKFTIGSGYYDGSITNQANSQQCDFRVYNRALDQAEIAQISAGLG